MKNVEAGVEEESVFSWLTEFGDIQQLHLLSKLINSSVSRIYWRRRGRSTQETILTLTGLRCELERTINVYETYTKRIAECNTDKGPSINYVTRIS